MKFPGALMLLFIATATPVVADEPESGKDYLARRGDGVVTNEMFDTRASRIPEADRPVVLRDRRRLQDLLNNLLLNAQLVADARAAQLEQVPEVRARMQLAADEELAKAWLQHVASSSKPADYQAMAREYYTANPERFHTDVALDLTHILIGTGSRSDAEALELAQQLNERINQDAAGFDALVLEYSDDPGAAANKGRYRNVRKGQMDKDFEKAAFAMREGEISQPVKTTYGYHLIRLDDIREPRAQAYEEVEEMLVERMRKRHEETVQSDYLSQLTSLPVEVSEDALEEMVRRQFGEEALAETAESEATE